jgi:hypothetical protein
MDPRGTFAISSIIGIKNSSFVVELHPHTGGSKIFPNNRPIQIGQCEIGDFDAVEQMRYPFEDKLLACLKESLAYL